MDTKADQVAGKDFDSNFERRFDCFCFVHEARPKKVNEFDYNGTAAAAVPNEKLYFGVWQINIAVMRGHSSTNQYFGFFFFFY